MTIPYNGGSSDALYDGTIRVVGEDVPHIPPNGGLHLSSAGGGAIVAVHLSDRTSGWRRIVMLSAGSELWLRAGALARVSVLDLAAGAALAWSWTDTAPAGGDGWDLLTQRLTAGVAAPVAPGAAEVEVYPSAPGTMTWGVQLSTPYVLPACPLGLPPPRLFVAGTHITTTVDAVAVWRLRVT